MSVCLAPSEQPGDHRRDVTNGGFMSRNQLGDAAILVFCIVGAVLSATWGLDQAPREYGLLLFVSVVGAILMARKLVQTWSR
jgi:uncharacterized membrane protein YeaQ/YmgE (transglycosylase-associated protein family)